MFQLMFKKAFRFAMLRNRQRLIDVQHTRTFLSYAFLFFHNVYSASFFCLLYQTHFIVLYNEVNQFICCFDAESSNYFQNFVPFLAFHVFHIIKTLFGTAGSYEKRFTPLDFTQLFLETSLSLLKRQRFLSFKWASTLVNPGLLVFFYCKSTSGFL